MDGEINIMELKDTVEMMLSDDYKERFKAEYYQLKIRHDKLQNMVDNWDKLNFTPTCAYSTYVCQLLDMEHYMKILRNRAEQEEVELDD
jgi:hypothetical protein